MSREAASHPSDEAGASRNTFIDPSEQVEQINAFSNVESDSEDDDDEDDNDDLELLMAIEAEVKSRREIERPERSRSSEMKSESEEWKEVPSRKKGNKVRRQIPHHAQEDEEGNKDEEVFVIYAYVPKKPDAGFSRP